MAFPAEKQTQGTGEVAQWLEAAAALVEDLGSVPTHVLVHNYL